METQIKNYGGAYAVQVHGHGTSAARLGQFHLYSFGEAAVKSEGAELLGDFQEFSCAWIFSMKRNAETGHSLAACDNFSHQPSVAALQFLITGYRTFCYIREGIHHKFCHLFTQASPSVTKGIDPATDRRLNRGAVGGETSGHHGRWGNAMFHGCD